MRDRKAQQRLEQLGDLQRSLGLLDDPSGKSPSELAMMFPRSKFKDLDDDNYFSMLDSLQDDAEGKTYSTEMDSLISNKATATTTPMIIDMDDDDSLQALIRLDTLNID